MDWELKLDGGATQFPTLAAIPSDAGEGLFWFFLVLGLIWLAAKLGEWLRSGVSKYYSPASVQQRQERCEEFARIEQERRERAEERRREQQERRAERDREAHEKQRKRRAIAELAEWYADQRKQIEVAVPAGHDREILLGELFGRYDALLKKAIEELQP